MGALYLPMGYVAHLEAVLPAIFILWGSAVNIPGAYRNDQVRVSHQPPLDWVLIVHGFKRGSSLNLGVVVETLLWHLLIARFVRMLVLTFRSS